MYYLENHRNSKLVNRKTRKIQATAKHDRNALVLKDILKDLRKQPKHSI